MLSGGWTEGSTVYPQGFDPIGTYDGAVVCTDPGAAGDSFHGIGCAWRDLGTPVAWVCVEWSGIWNGGVTDGTPHVEAAPLIHVTPGTSRHAFGVWTAGLDLGGGAFPCLFAGYIGNPGSMFEVVDVAAFTHTPGTPRVVTLAADGAGGARCYLDGALVENWVESGTRLPVDPVLSGSGCHGFAVDAHYTPAGDVPTAKGIEQVRIRTPNPVRWTP